MVFESIPVLSSGVSSVVPVPGKAVAVLASVPAAAAGFTVAVTKTITVPPLAISANTETLPTPFAVAHDEPDDAEQLQVALISVLGNISEMAVATEVEGPAFFTVIVYVDAVPGTLEADPSDFVTVRSTLGVTVSVSDAEESPGVGSVVPAGFVALNVFFNEPAGVAGSTVAVSVYVATPEGKRSTVELIEPLPEALAQLDPGVAAQVHVALVSEAGRVSTTEAPLERDGPLFVTVIVYTVDAPGMIAVEPLVFVDTRSACGVSGIDDVAESPVGSGSSVPISGVIEAVFARVPVAEGSIVAFTTNVAVVFGASATVDTTFPMPLAAAHDAPTPAGVHVHVTAVNAAGRVSTVAAVAVDGPAFDTTSVYWIGEPGTALMTEAVFVIERFATRPSVSVSVA
jgi:hypothetical protein